jgi:hypothetical protein
MERSGGGAVRQRRRHLSLGGAGAVEESDWESS